MAEAVLITAVAEPMPAASGAPVAPGGAAAEGIFAGMLEQRLQAPAGAGEARARPGQPGAAPAVEAPPVPAAAALPPGQVSPQGGKALPAEAALPDDAGALPVTDGLLSGLPLVAGAAAGDMAAAVAQRLAGTAVEAPQDTAEGDATAAWQASAVAPLSAQAALAVASADPLRPSEALPSMVKPNTASTGQGERPPPSTALKLAALGGGQSPATADPSLRPASLGLAARPEATEPGRAGVTTPLAAQGLNDGSSMAAANQASRGESLSRQFQLQMGRLLAGAQNTAPIGAAATPTAFAETVSSLAAGDPPAGNAPPLSGIGGDFRTLLPASATPSLPVASVVGQPGWSAELGQRMVWLARQEIREAQIQLNPRSLGPIDVRIVYSDTQQLSVSFTAHNLAAREALDAALPRLREMFDQQGLSLADASVSRESFSGQRGDGHGADDPRETSRHAEGRTPWSDTDQDESPQQAPPRIIAQGLVDTFA